MEQNQNLFVAVNYKLYTVKNGQAELVEEAPTEKPFQFISGFGITLDSFEQQILKLEKGADFNFELTSEQAYGQAEAERIIDLERSIFNVNGQFDSQHIFEGAIVPLKNEDGNLFYGRVLLVGEEKVRIDLNHPLAGKTLRFEGHVIEKREATNQEISKLIEQLSQDHCGCGDCGDCGSDCGDNEGGCGCGCGHCH